MATIVLRPTGAGSMAEWTPSAGANWQNVDDSSPDADTTYNAVATGSDSFSTDGGIPAGSIINSIVLTHRSRRTGTVGLVSATVTHDGEVFTLDSDVVIGTYADYSSDPVDTLTGEGDPVPLTADIVNNLEIGVIGAADTTVRCTQLYMTVDYTPPTSAAVASELANLVAAVTAINANPATAATEIANLVAALDVTHTAVSDGPIASSLVKVGAEVVAVHGTDPAAAIGIRLVPASDVVDVSALITASVAATLAEVEAELQGFFDTAGLIYEYTGRGYRSGGAHFRRSRT